MPSSAIGKGRGMRIEALAVAAVALSGGAATAQPLFTEVTATHLPPRIEGRCMDTASGDVDGDGDLDLALAIEFDPKILLLNDGEARFRDASAQLPRAVHDSEDVAF